MKKNDLIKDTLFGIYEKYNKLDSDVVIKEVSDISHPLHSLFDWNDTTAAHKYRLQQAEDLIRTVKLELFSCTNEYKSVRCFVHLESESDNTSYTPLSIVQMNELKHKELLEQYANDAKIYIERFADLANSKGFYRDMKTIFTLIEKTVRAQ